MVVDPEGQFLTQREHPALALIRPEPARRRPGRPCARPGIGDTAPVADRTRPNGDGLGAHWPRDRCRRPSRGALISDHLHTPGPAGGAAPGPRASGGPRLRARPHRGLQRRVPAAAGGAGVLGRPQLPPGAAAAHEPLPPQRRRRRCTPIRRGWLAAADHRRGASRRCKTLRSLHDHHRGPDQGGPRRGRTAAHAGDVPPRYPRRDVRVQRRPRPPRPLGRG